MRLLFVAKREPQQRDLITRPYGRFHFLPTELARSGHEVHMLLVSHRGTAATSIERDGIRITAFNPRNDGLKRTLDSLESQALAWRPDWVVGCSDAWYGWLAHRLAKRVNAALAIDAYDNYESYMSWNFPLHAAWRRALRAADVLAAAGPQLAAFMQRSRTEAQRVVDIVPMAADPMFTAHNREVARASLGLPPAAPLVGYFGSWTNSRGLDSLLAAFFQLRQLLPNACLVLSGRPPAHVAALPGVHALGYIDDALLPVALSALDVACVITADTAFGRYSYPAKMCEAMACRVPVVATATAPVRWMLQEDARFLVRIGDAAALAERMFGLLGMGRHFYGRQHTWEDSARHFDAALRAVSPA
ncbi:glycosyltransferase family 4 protein [Variovorax arabinosiphilus]|uniref:glycosyltransferase family 4 protein n=1 Tax=Variovorax arabinosiphilus TaxID=3053498 RepID=UPI0025763733|nr:MULTISPECIES: glycosyltransferase family 4 protein [unclassified Variovorax]MDM0121772.1 glycosyltransferase family 4 protein [Variovorax sp. J2L1-78]MDM0130833.1 glycosyltransferase family 4 protein [Variovorax sp. J2L1-63]MDM0234535.1 glycosyltransferase family 4 protein [Variovorax sp. J2R1-6]